MEDEVMANPETGAGEPLDVHESLMNIMTDEGGLEDEPAEATPEESESTPVSEAPAPVEAPVERPKFKVKVNGEEMEVDQDELIKGYQLERDYRHKTAELSEQRKAIEAERSTYNQNLNVLASQLQHAVAQDQQIDWKSLLENDPVEYLRQKEAATNRAQALQAAQFEQSRVLQQHQIEQQSQLQNFLKEQRDHLLAKLPDWKDEAKAKAEQSELKQFLVSNGLTEPEINGIADHRMILLARKAMLYDKTVQNADLSAKKVSGLPPKVERPGNAQGAPDKTQEAMRRLRRSGDTRDAAAALANLDIF